MDKIEIPDLETVRYERKHPRDGVVVEAITVKKGTSEEDAWREADLINEWVKRYEALPGIIKGKMLLNRIVDEYRSLQKQAQHSRVGLDKILNGNHSDITSEDKTAMIKFHTNAYLFLDLMMSEIQRHVGDESRRNLEW